MYQCVSFESKYELAQHIPMGLSVGCSEAQVKAILEHGKRPGFFEAKEAEEMFTPKELVLLSWIQQVALKPEVPDAMMEAVKAVRLRHALGTWSAADDPSFQYYCPREITEALTLHGWYYMVVRPVDASPSDPSTDLHPPQGRLSTVLKIDVDDVGGLDVLAAFSGIAKQ